MKATDAKLGDTIKGYVAWPIREIRHENGNIVFVLKPGLLEVVRAPEENM